MRWLILSAVLSVAVPSIARAQSADACQSQVPLSLSRVLKQRFPQYHVPSVSDSLAEDVQFNRTRGGNGCLLVNRADFDGDGREDVTVGLKPNAGRAPLVVVALVRDRGWSISTIRSWVDDIDRLYISSAPPGLHKRTESLDGPLQPNERQSLRCDRAAVIVGATESTGIAYCYVNARWLHVWISD